MASACAGPTTGAATCHVESQVPGIVRGGIRQGVRSLITALRRINNLCMAATGATFLGFAPGNQARVEGQGHRVVPDDRERDHVQNPTHRGPAGVEACFAPLLRWVLDWWQGPKPAPVIDPTSKGEVPGPGCQRGVPGPGPARGLVPEAGRPTRSLNAGTRHPAGCFAAREGQWPGEPSASVGCTAPCSCRGSPLGPAHGRTPRLHGAR